MRYSNEPKDRIYAKGYGFLSFAESTRQSLSCKYGPKLLDSTEKSATDAPKTASKGLFKKTAEIAGDSVGNKIAEKIQKTASKTTCEDPRKSTAQLYETTQSIGIPKEKYISPEKWQQIIDELQLL